MTGTVYTCLHTNQSRSYLNHLVIVRATVLFTSGTWVCSFPFALSRPEGHNRRVICMEGPCKFYDRRPTNTTLSSGFIVLIILVAVHSWITAI